MIFINLMTPQEKSSSEKKSTPRKKIFKKSWPLPNKNLQEILAISKNLIKIMKNRPFLNDPLTAPSTVTKKRFFYDFLLDFWIFLMIFDLDRPP